MNAPELHHYPWILLREVTAMAHMQKLSPNDSWGEAVSPNLCFFGLIWCPSTMPSEGARAVKSIQAMLPKTDPEFPFSLCAIYNSFAYGESSAATLPFLQVNKPSILLLYSLFSLSRAETDTQAAAAGCRGLWAGAEGVNSLSVQRDEVRGVSQPGMLETPGLGPSPHGISPRPAPLHITTTFQPSLSRADPLEAPN